MKNVYASHSYAMRFAEKFDGQMGLMITITSQEHVLNVTVIVGVIVVVSGLNCSITITYNSNMPIITVTV